MNVAHDNRDSDSNINSPCCARAFNLSKDSIPLLASTHRIKILPYFKASMA
jgi:hypothetical protein